ncbi:hypothetical protein DPEC_G00375990 [Dallia pectoralis]|nr:hypothetical protein DPEC_G00375990 [Dallia pectoralis]
MQFSIAQSHVCSDEVRPTYIPVRGISVHKPENVPDTSVRMGRVSMNRKRAHQAQERERVRREEVDGMEDNSVPSDQTSSKAGSEKASDGGISFMPLYPLKSYLSSIPPTSRSSCSESLPLVIRSILRHSESQDLDSSLSMEIATKKRRMTNPYRVQFSEEVVVMPPSVLIWQDHCSEEESEEEPGTDEDSSLKEDTVMEEEVKVLPIKPQSAAPLPAWVQALKKRTRTRTRKYKH